jgi:hypothetical protein
VSHATASNVGLMMDFYALTGDAKFLKRLPEAIDWLDAIRLPAAIDPQRRCPTFVEIGTNRPMYLHRRGSDVVNGRYFHNDDPTGTVAHYSSFRAIDVDRLRQRLASLASRPVTTSLLTGGRRALPRYFTLAPIGLLDLMGKDMRMPSAEPAKAAQVLAALDEQGRWITPLKNSSHRYTRDGYPEAVPGDFSRTYVGDDTDTSPFPVKDGPAGISTEIFVRNMAVLTGQLTDRRARQTRV